MNDLRTLFRIWLLLIAIPFSPVSAQSRDTTFKLLFEFGGGYGLSDEALSQSVSTDGVSILVRFMWKPDHRLKAGFESGWLPIASINNKEVKNEFGTVKLNAAMNAIPVMAVFDLDIWRLNLYTGLGYYFLKSTIGTEEEAITNTRWDVGFYLALAYKYPISEQIKICSELKWCSVGELGKTILSAEVFVSYHLSEL